MFDQASASPSYWHPKVTLVAMKKARRSLSVIYLPVRQCYSFISSCCSSIDCRIAIASTKDVVAFHAGTANSNGDIVTSGGRVMAISAYAPTLEGALKAAYAGVDNVSFEGKTFRRDIAQRCVPFWHSSIRYLTPQSGLCDQRGNPRRGLLTLQRVCP